VESGKRNIKGVVLHAGAHRRQAGMPVPLARGVKETKTGHKFRGRAQARPYKEDERRAGPAGMPALRGREKKDGDVKSLLQGIYETVVTRSRGGRCRIP
jgi:hypothetical protein